MVDEFSIGEITASRGINGVLIESVRMAKDARLRRLASGARLFGAGDSPRSVGVITSGRIALCRELSGRRVILEVLGAGDPVGDLPMLVATETGCDAIAIAETTVVEVAASQFMACLVHDPRLARGWLVASWRRSSAMHERLLDLLAGSLRSQIAALLLHLSADSDQVDFTHETLAGLLGVGRSSVTRVLGDLQGIGALALRRGQLYVTDRAALDAIVAGS